MKSTLSISLLPLLLILLSNSVLSQDEYCNGSKCTSTQFCDESFTPKRCVPKKPFGDTCTAEKQCITSNSECLGEPMICQCVDNFVESNKECVPKCSAENLACSTGTFCSSVINGCLPQVDLDRNCIEGEAETQCKTMNATCTEGTCNCGPVFANKDGVCIPRCSSLDTTSCNAIQYCEDSSELCKPKKYLGEVCEINEQCLQANSVCGDDLKCACSPPYIDYFGSCLPSCATNTDCSSDQYCDNICSKKANLHQGCKAAVDSCMDQNSDCTSIGDRTPTCECNNNFVDKDGSCAPKCTTADCGPNEFCNSQSGLCDPQRPLGASCSAPGASECSEEFSECGGSPPRCTCSADYVQSGAKCVKKCIANSECGSSDLYCNMAFGICSPKISLNGFCSSTDTDPCKTNEASCQGDPSTCSCNVDFVEDKVTSSCVVKCKSTTDCGSEQFCDTTTGACNNKIDLLGQCLENGMADQCKAVNSECLTLTNPDSLICLCKDGFAQRDNSCIAKCLSTTDCEGANEYCEINSGLCNKKAELNQTCSYADQCSSKDAECQGDSENNKICTCKSEFVQWSSVCRERCTLNELVCKDTEYCQDDDLCYRKVGLHKPCTADNQCSSDSANCTLSSGSSGTTTCECDPDFIDKGTYCLTACTKTSGCDFDLQFCDYGFSRECTSKLSLNYKCNEEGYEQCLGPLTSCQGPEEKLLCSCNQNAATAAGADKCSCIQNFVASVDTRRCLQEATKIQDTCEEPQQCYVLGNGDSASASCVNEKCICQSGFLNSTAATKCLKIASLIEDSCEESQQCKDLENDQPDSIDCTNNKCMCQTGFLKSTDAKKCLKEASQIEDACEESQQCQTLDDEVTGSANCVDSKCLCQTNFLNSTDAKKCLKVASALGDNCYEVKQCNGLAYSESETTSCSNNKCDCTATSIKAEGKCFMQKLVGTSCKDDKECTVGIEGDVGCDSTSNQCKCATDFRAETDGLKCSPYKSGASEMLNINYVLLIASSFAFLKF